MTVEILLALMIGITIGAIGIVAIALRYDKKNK